MGKDHGQGQFGVIQTNLFQDPVTIARLNGADDAQFMQRARHLARTMTDRPNPRPAG